MSANEEQLRRWRLILGANDNEGTGYLPAGLDLQIDRALEALYDSERSGGLSGSSPKIARWLGDIRTYFPNSVVRIMQQDALERLGLKQMLLEPEMLEAVEPDVHLVATLLSLSRVMPNKTKETARMVVRKVVDELERKLANPLRQAVTGSLNRSVRNRRPRHNEIDWERTIRANLKHYQPEYKTIIPDTPRLWASHFGFARHHFVCGPERFDGGFRCLFEHHGCGAGVNPFGQDFARGIRYVGGRPYGAARRSCRGAVRNSIGWWHRHQSRACLHAGPGTRTERYDSCSDHRSVRGWKRGRDVEAGGNAGEFRCSTGYVAGA
jgi:hypothetical protein